MDVERLQNFKARIINLSDSSPLSTWKNIIQESIELYKIEMLETFVGTQNDLNTKRNGINAAATSLLALMDLPTDKVLKGGA